MFWHKFFIFFVAVPVQPAPETFAHSVHKVKKNGKLRSFLLRLGFLIKLDRLRLLLLCFQLFLLLDKCKLHLYLGWMIG